LSTDVTDVARKGGSNQKTICLMFKYPGMTSKRFKRSKTYLFIKYRAESIIIIVKSKLDFILFSTKEIKTVSKKHKLKLVWKKIWIIFQFCTQWTIINWKGLKGISKRLFCCKKEIKSWEKFFWTFCNFEFNIFDVKIWRIQYSTMLQIICNLCKLIFCQYTYR